MVHSQSYHVLLITEASARDQDFPLAHVSLRPYD